MNLIDHYVRVVRSLLPRGQRHDIANELAEDLRSQAADREKELGRPLNEDEQARLLEQYGHPMLIAARYRSSQHLIGTVVFSHYRAVITLVLGLILLGHAVAAGVLVAGGGTLAELGSLFRRFFDMAMVALVGITALAVLADRWIARSRILENWDPRSLRPDGHVGRAVRDVGRVVERAGNAGFLARRAFEEASPPRVGSMTQLVVLAVLGAWCLLGMKFPSLMFGGPALLDWSPLVHRLYPFLVVAQAAILTDHYMRLKGPQDATYLRIMRVVWANAGWILLLLLSMSDRQWLVWAGTNEEWARFGALVRVAGRTWSLVDLVNAVITTALLVVAAASLAGSFLRLSRIVTRRSTAHRAVA
jgi:hypothetical protein